LFSLGAAGAAVNEPSWAPASDPVGADFARCLETRFLGRHRRLKQALDFGRENLQCFLSMLLSPRKQ